MSSMVEGGEQGSFFRTRRPLRAMCEFGDLGEEAAGDMITTEMVALAGLGWLERCVPVPLGKKGVYLWVRLTDIALGHEERRRALYREDVQMDGISRQCREMALDRLEDIMKECIYTPLRNVVERASKYLQDCIGVAPNREDEQYRRVVEDHFTGRKDPPVYWEHLEDESVTMRLVHAEDHEKTAALFINFKQFAGIRHSFWDWSALCSFCESCKVARDCTIGDAAEREWLTVPPADKVAFTAKQRGVTMAQSILDVARMVRDIRNPMKHDGIIDTPFQEKFDQAVMATAALGGDIARAAEIREGARELLPAQNTVELIRQYESQYQGHAKLLTGGQCGKLAWMVDQASPGYHLLQAPSGTGKSLLVVKYACDYLIRQKRAAREGGHRSPPLIVLTPSRPLKEHLACEICKEFDEHEVTQGAYLTSGGIQLRLRDGGGCQVVLSTIDEFIEVGEHPVHFGTALVDEGQQVFSRQTNHSIEGQHLVAAADVRGHLQGQIREQSRVFIFHDVSYQTTEEAPIWPEPNEEHSDFLTDVIRMPSSVRDLSAPQCRQLGNSNGYSYFRLKDESVRGKEIKYYEHDQSTEGHAQQLAGCLRQLLNEEGLEPGQIAVLHPPDWGQFSGQKFRELFCAEEYRGHLATIGDVARVLCVFMDQRHAGLADIKNHIEPFFAANPAASTLVKAQCRTENWVLEFCESRDEFEVGEREAAAAVQACEGALTLTGKGKALATSSRSRLLLDKVRGSLVLSALDDLEIGLVSEGLYWGPVQNFMGLERAAVIVTGFSHLLAKSQTDNQTDRCVSPLVYTAVTRSKFVLCVVEPNARGLFEHYKIGQSKQGVVSHSVHQGWTAIVDSSSQDRSVGLLRMEQLHHVDGDVQEDGLKAMKGLHLENLELLEQRRVMVELLERTNDPGSIGYHTALEVLAGLAETQLNVVHDSMRGRVVESLAVNLRHVEASLCLQVARGLSLLDLTQVCLGGVRERVATELFAQIDHRDSQVRLQLGVVLRKQSLDGPGMGSVRSMLVQALTSTLGACTTAKIDAAQTAVQELDFFMEQLGETEHRARSNLSKLLSKITSTQARKFLDLSKELINKQQDQALNKGKLRTLGGCFIKVCRDWQGLDDSKSQAAIVEVLLGAVSRLSLHEEETRALVASLMKGDSAASCNALCQNYDLKIVVLQYLQSLDGKSISPRHVDVAIQMLKPGSQMNVATLISNVSLLIGKRWETMKRLQSEHGVKIMIVYGNTKPRERTLVVVNGPRADEAIVEIKRVTRERGSDLGYVGWGFFGKLGFKERPEAWLNLSLPGVFLPVRIKALEALAKRCSRMEVAEWARMVSELLPLVEDPEVGIRECVIRLLGKRKLEDVWICSHDTTTGDVGDLVTAPEAISTTGPVTWTIQNQKQWTPQRNGGIEECARALEARPDYVCVTMFGEPPEFNEAPFISLDVETIAQVPAHALPCLCDPADPELRAVRAVAFKRLREGENLWRVQMYHLVGEPPQCSRIQGLSNIDFAIDGDLTPEGTCLRREVELASKTEDCTQATVAWVKYKRATNRTDSDSVFQAQYLHTRNAVDKIVSKLAKRGHVKGVQAAMGAMRDVRLEVDEVTFTSLIKAHAQNDRDAVGAYGALQDMRDAGLRPDQQAFQVVLDTYANIGDVSGARRLWNEIEAAGLQPNAFTWNSLLKVYANTKNESGATQVLREMHKAGFQPDAFAITYLSTFPLLGEHVRDAAIASTLANGCGVRKTGKVTQISETKDMCPWPQIFLGNIYVPGCLISSDQSTGIGDILTVLAVRDEIHDNWKAIEVLPDGAVGEENCASPGRGRSICGQDGGEPDAHWLKHCPETNCKPGKRPQGASPRPHEETAGLRVRENILRVLLATLQDPLPAMQQCAKETLRELELEGQQWYRCAIAGMSAVQLQGSVPPGLSPGSPHSPATKPRCVQERQTTKPRQQLQSERLSMVSEPSGTRMDSRHQREAGSPGEREEPCESRLSHTDSKKGKRAGKGTNSKPGKGYKCNCCGEPGGTSKSHWIQQCPAAASTADNAGKGTNSKPGKGYKCNCCGEPGGTSKSHWIQQCPAAASKGDNAGKGTNSKPGKGYKCNCCGQPGGTLKSHWIDECPESHPNKRKGQRNGKGARRLMP
eukprot:TRINITY_DN2080_c0_g1_i10.p1 TRINITY_DN2080_c0_g1~~TRINITY_DN2080_c0_g1_i10.p1  ORF type:complete len:2132 (+),score=212.81 TRINITY_DN2080_c0_g1_i10:570-6965(+)